MFFKKQNKELEKFAHLLERGTSNLLKERGGFSFSAPVKLQKKQIIEYEGKMRADGMDKFNHEPTYVSAVNYFATEKDMEKNKTLGAVIVYVEKTYIAKLMKMLKYPPIDDESEKALQDSCGTLSNIIAGRFKTEVSAEGFIDLEMSHFVNFRNNAFLGIDFCRSEYDMYELQCDIDGQTRLVMDMSMGPVPSR